MELNSRNLLNYNFHFNCHSLFSLLPFNLIQTSFVQRSAYFAEFEASQLKVHYRAMQTNSCKISFKAIALYSRLFLNSWRVSISKRAVNACLFIFKSFLIISQSAHGFYEFSFLFIPRFRFWQYGRWIEVHKHEDS